MSVFVDPTIEREEKKRLESWTAKAKRLGVSTKTLDRWAARGIISPPAKIRGRKYGSPDEEPVLDAAE